MITNVDVSKIEAHRGSRDQISNMKFNVAFDDVKVDKENVHVGFTFSAFYEGEAGAKGDAKEVGKLVISGKVTSKEEKAIADEVQKTWEAKKTLPLKFAEDVLNIITFECGARGTLIAYSMGFIAPLPMSRTKLQEGPSNVS
jgi:hypothetical protein